MHWSWPYRWRPVGGLLPHLPRSGAVCCCPRCRAAPGRRCSRVPAARPEQSCCGQPAVERAASCVTPAGSRAECFARSPDAEAVVVPAGSCAAMMRLHWRHLFHRRARPRARRARGRAHLRALRSISSTKRVAASGAAARSEVDLSRLLPHAARASPHHQPRTLLAAVAELQELPRAERCCGFGGTFCVKLPAVSVAMADDRLARVDRVRRPDRRGGDLSCLDAPRGSGPRGGAGVRSCTSPPSWPQAL